MFNLSRRERAVIHNVAAVVATVLACAIVIQITIFAPRIGW